MQKTFK